jgi:hypothetical protein
MIYGRNRVHNSDSAARNKVHIYAGTFGEPGDPLCPKGWNRGKNNYSIWRDGSPDLTRKKPDDVCRDCWNKALALTREVVE